MEPDFVWDQVKHLRRALQASIQQIKERELRPKNDFLDLDLVLRQAAVLEHVVGDSVMLYGMHGDTQKFFVSNAEFSLKQAQNVHTAVSDYVQLQNSASGSTLELSTSSPQFALDLARVLENVVCDNAKAAVQHNVNVNTLNMSQPLFVASLLGCFLQLMHSHVSLYETVGSSHVASLRAESALEKLKNDYEQMCGAQRAAQSRILDMESAFQGLQQEKQRIEVAADAADGVAQARMVKVMSDLETLHSERAKCESKIQEQATEITMLRVSYEELVILHQAQVADAVESASQLALKSDELQKMITQREKLTANFAGVHQKYDALVHARAFVQERMVSQLDPRLSATRGDVSDTLEREIVAHKATADRLESEVLAAIQELFAAEVQYDAWQAMAEEVLSRQDSELSEWQKLAAQKRADREAADNLLQNAARKIEELELKLRTKEEEIEKLRGAAVRKDTKKPPTPVSPPPSQKLSRKRAFSSGGKVKSMNFVAQPSPLPPRRAEELASLSQIDIDLGLQTTVHATFTRSSLANILGGSCQGLIVRVAWSATELAKKHNVQGFLCPNTDHNPWSPTGPGEHGYMQVGLGRDAAYFNEEGEYRHIFVGTGKYLVYCGYYHAIRVEPLTREEWDTFPQRVKMTYSARTVNKDKSGKLTSAEEVLKMYNEGELHAPCVRLQCLKFDTAFYQELVQANNQYFSNKPGPVLPQNKPAKRRKVTNGNETDESEDDTPLALVTCGTVLATPSTSSMESASAILPTSLQPQNVPADPVTPPTSAVPVLSATPSVLSSPSRIQTRSAARLPPSLKLRIPGRSSQSCARATDVKEDEEMSENRLTESSLSDDDDLYAD